MKMSKSRQSKRLLLILCSVLITGVSVKPAVAGSFIEVDGRFITIMGKTFCWLNCDELILPPPLVRHAAILQPKPR